MQETNVNYSLSEFHVQKPFLPRQHVWDLLHEVYGSTAREETPNPGNSSLFQFYMVCAIAAVKLHSQDSRGADHRTPLSFFAAAQQYRTDAELTHGILGIQNLLLLARFGAYYHMGKQYHTYDLTGS
jgi:hypothetical protein